MRQPTFDADYPSTVRNITTVVQNLIQVCEKSLDSTASSNHRPREQNVLRDLEASNLKLANIGGDNSASSERISKQRLAASAYEVAKFTKELVSLFSSP